MARSNIRPGVIRRRAWQWLSPVAVGLLVVITISVWRSAAAPAVPQALLAHAGEPVPRPPAAITPATAGRVVQLARWGDGWPAEMIFSPDGRRLAIGSSIGVDIYDVPSLTRQRSIPTPIPVTDIAFAPDGATLATALWDTTVRLWGLDDSPAAPPRQVLEGHAGAVYGLAFTSDGAALSTISADRTLHVWRVSDGALLRTLGGTNERPVLDAALAPAGDLLATYELDSDTGTERVRLWAVAGDTMTHVLDLADQSGMAFDPDGAVLATRSAAGKVQFWEVAALRAGATPTRSLEGHTAPVWDLAFSSDGATLVTASKDGTARLWSTPQGTLTRSVEGQAGGVWGVAFASGAEILATGSWDGAVRLWRVGDGGLLGEVRGYGAAVLGIAFAPDGATLASASWDETVRLWRVSDGTLARELRGHRDIVSAVAFAPDGATLASASWDETVRLWRVSDGTLARELRGHRNIVSGVAFTPQGDTLVSVSEDGTGRLWPMAGEELRTVGEDLEAGARPEHMLGGAGAERVTSVAFTPDGALLATGDAGGRVILRQMADGAFSRSLSGHGQPVAALAFSPDGQLLATAAQDGLVQVWRVADGALAHTLRADRGDLFTSVVFDPGGEVLAGGAASGMVRLWRAADGQPLQSLEGHTSRVTGVTFAPDGKLLASAAEDGTIRLWGVPPVTR